jgi:hypothetical protein
MEFIGDTQAVPCSFVDFQIAEWNITDHLIVDLNIVNFQIVDCNIPDHICNCRLRHWQLSDCQMAYC